MTGSSARSGFFVVIEGTDGSGKTTQYERLTAHLQAAGHEVVTIHFPRYNEPSSYFVREYLAGHYGSADEVGPYTASLFYALDRFQAADYIRRALSEGKVVLCDRFTGANMAHQGTKFNNVEERRGYFIWLDNMEFEILRIPRPDITLVLNTPVEAVLERLREKGRSSVAVKKDVHEIDEGHIARSLEVYQDLCQLFPKDFHRIDCARSGKLLGIETVHELIWQKVEPMLPQPSKKPPKAGSPEVSAPLPALTDTPYVVKRADDTYEITAEGKTFLAEAVTSSDGNVYGFFEALSPVTIAAAMARLSRRGDDMRVTILDEFAGKGGRDDKLLRRVITAYGDDSVQQLVGQHIVVENASNWLTKKLEWGRLAAYLEQSTRYIYFDQKDKNGHYKYHTPDYLPAKLASEYRETLDAIFELYSSMVRQLTEYIQEKSDAPKAERDAAWKSATRAQACDAVRAVLPVATTSTVGIFASAQALESLIMHLLADEMPEARETGEQLLRAARKVIPTFLERADKPERGGSTIAYLAETRRGVEKLAQDFLPETHAAPKDAVKLTDIWPRNELDLVPDMLYEHSSLSLKELQAEVSAWPYDRKLEVFTAYMGKRLNRRQRPGRALEKAHYSWDLLCDYGIFRDLQRHRMVDDLEWQMLTPRYGYEIPKPVEAAGVAEQFERCFDLSLKLYSSLQAAGFPLEAQYATLLGHRMRWKVTYNAREAFHLHELRTSPQGHPGYRKLVLAMHEKLAEVHPLLAEAMQFVNRGEDPELSRLAAERYTQFKLEQLASATDETP